MLLRSLIIIAILFLAPRSQAAVLLELHSNVELSKLSYSLSDVASLRCDNGRSCESILDLTVGKTPRPGYIAHISRRDIQAHIRAVMPNIKLKWTGAELVRIQSVGIALDGERITLRAMHALQQWLSESYKDFSMAPVQPTDMQQIPVGQLSLQARLDEGRTLASRMPVWVDVLIDGQHFHSIPVWFSVSVLENVWVAKNNLKAMSEISKDDFTIENRDIAALKGNFLPLSEDLLGLRLTRKLMPGQMLGKDDVEWLPPVIRGSEVWVYVASGKINIKTLGVAMQDGDLFETVKVKGPTSLVSYNAVVIGHGQVKVD